VMYFDIILTMGQKAFVVECGGCGQHLNASIRRGKGTPVPVEVRIAMSSGVLSRLYCLKERIELTDSSKLSQPCTRGGSHRNYAPNYVFDPDSQEYKNELERRQGRIEYDRGILHLRNEMYH